MRLKVAVVGRDVMTGEIVSEDPVGDQVTTIDVQSKTASFAPTDSVDIEAIFWNRVDGIFQVHFSLGAYDPAGVFYRNPNYGLVSEAWGRKLNPALWQKYNLDSLPVDIESIKNWLYQENVVYFAGRDKWRIPSMDVKLCDDDGSVLSNYKRRISGG